VKCGHHKRILCWGCPNFIIWIVLIPFTLQKAPSFPLFHQVSYYFGLYNPETKYGFWIIKSELHQTHSVGGLHHKENVFLWIWPVVNLKNVFLHVFFDYFNGFSTLPSYIYHPSPPPFLTQTSPTLSSTSFYNHVFSSLAFHRRRSLWKFLGIVWTVNEDGTALQRSVVHLGVMLASLGMRLVCLGARLTIMVSCSLEAHVPPPALFSSSHPPSFLSTSGWSH